MALITVKDLPQSIELDRRAMHAIVGGARAGVRPLVPEATTLRSGSRIVDYPPGFNRESLTQANGQGSVG